MLKLQKFKKKTDKVNIKNLLISFGIILLGLTILGVYKTFAIYKIDKEYDLIVSKIGDFRGKNQVISYYINNQESDVIPEDKNYEVYVNCENATGTWNESEWKLELSNITKYTVTCTVNFKERYVIENAKSTNNSIIANYSNIENISTNYYLYGTDKNNLNEKNNEIINLNNDTTYYFKKCYEDNNEEICSEVSKLLTAGKVTNFDYTGGEQTYQTSCKGKYKLETWGAQGGSSIQDGILYETSGYGGYGGYSSSEINLTLNTKIYINVGGRGKDGAVNVSESLGGYNGGGNGLWDKSDDESTGGGGGATHIAFRSGLLSSLENYKFDVLTVAGGGGGGAWSFIGGSGGGFKGNMGIRNQVSIGYYSSPGTQTNGNLFGKGGDGTLNDGTPGGGGGGGYYGGFGGIITIADAIPGAGGSGYIGNSSLTDKVMYCYNCEESNEESTKTISTTCANETPTENCSKQGNGYARITIEECSI